MWSQLLWRLHGEGQEAENTQISQVNSDSSSAYKIGDDWQGVKGRMF